MQTISATENKTDLHLHTTKSDGLLRPADIVAWAKSVGLDTIAVTDHDTTYGLDEALRAGEQLGIQVLAGIEFSTYSDTEIHILGYGIDYRSDAFVKKLEEIKDMRGDRNRLMVARLAEKGIFLKHEYGRDKGRAHMAREIVEQGLTATMNEAFDRYVGKHGCGYVAGKRLLPPDAVELIRVSGGKAVLAHPRQYLQNGTLEAILNQLTPLGLAGIEVYYPTHTPHDVAVLESIARGRGLFCTGGSDMHDPKLYTDVEFSASPTLLHRLRGNS